MKCYEQLWFFAMIWNCNQNGRMKQVIISLFWSMLNFVHWNYSSGQFLWDEGDDTRQWKEGCHSWGCSNIKHANLVQMYDTFCEETGFTPLSKSSLFQILRICPASKRTSLRGLDNVAVDGASAFETLNEVIKQLKTSFTQ